MLTALPRLQAIKNTIGNTVTPYNPLRHSAIDSSISSSVDSLTLQFSGSKKCKLSDRPDKDQTAIYAGSFDPPTLGHLSIIRRAAEKYKKVVVVTALNADKKGTFNFQERLDMLNEMLKQLPEALQKKIEIVSLKNHYVVHYAQKIGAGVLVRGIRDAADLAYESTLAQVNQLIANDVKTEFIETEPQLKVVSSSMVRGLIGFVGWREAVSHMVSPPILEHLKQYYLKNRLSKLNDAVGLSGTQLKEISEQLIERYNKPERAYHNLDHLITMFEILDEQLEPALRTDKIKKPENLALLELAIWYHDAVDDRKNPNAVPEATQLTSALFSTIRHPQVAKSVEQLNTLILSTQHPSPPEIKEALEQDSELLNTAQWLNDLDLAILGQPPEKYKRYAAQIRQEYNFVPDAAYAEGRIKVLQNILSAPNLFQTEWGKERFEIQARKNMTNEIKALKKQVKAQQINAKQTEAQKVA